MVLRAEWCQTNQEYGELIKLLRQSEMNGLTLCREASLIDISAISPHQ